MSSAGLWRIIRYGAVGLALAAAVAGLLLGDEWLWLAVEWSPPSGVWLYTDAGLDTPTTVTLIVAAAVKAALLWLILRTPRQGTLDRRAKALRALLYLMVANALVLWMPIGLLPDVVDAVFSLVLWAAVYVLYLLVIRWRSSGLRAAAGVVFAVDLALTANGVLDRLDLPEFGPSALLVVSPVVATVLTVVGQWRDGRWSRGTLVLGWSSMGLYALIFPFDWLVDEIFPDGTAATTVVWNTIALVTTVWYAATARELAAESRPAAGPSPARRRLNRVLVAAVTVLPLTVLIQPERTAHLTYSGGSSDCYHRPAFGDLEPEERDAVFLCRARSTEGGVAPMFPDTMSDQAILAYGRVLCRTEDRDEQQEILARAGSVRSTWGVDAWDLVYVCPETVGATRPDLLRSTAETQVDHADYIAEANARCRDPWPRTKGVVQATANYFLFVDGDPGYLVYDPELEQAAEEATDRSYDDSTGIGVAGTAALVGHVADVSDVCLTVKAFRAAPPPRTAGWDQVSEVPLISRSGRLSVPEMDGGEVGAGAPMPNLAIKGKGRYRLRVYIRANDAEEEHLVVVFPGASRKKLKLKS
ncbi:hypothetical protein GCM10009733_043070 [Nonomuraea maheshkhaliensis]|uniref:Uncharacterized protein n=1 Tax=Nonomuraea maheshkhaliensis TaxID=419590 RepID=A0ABN2FEF7_9ACTN